MWVWRFPIERQLGPDTRQIRAQLTFSASFPCHAQQFSPVLALQTHGSALLVLVSKVYATGYGCPAKPLPGAVSPTRGPLGFEVLGPRLDPCWVALRTTPGNSRWLLNWSDRVPVTALRAKEATTRPPPLLGAARSFAPVTTSKSTASSTKRHTCDKQSLRSRQLPQTVGEGCEPCPARPPTRWGVPVERASVHSRAVHQEEVQEKKRAPRRAFCRSARRVPGPGVPYQTPLNSCGEAFGGALLRFCWSLCP